MCDWVQIITECYGFDFVFDRFQIVFIYTPISRIAELLQIKLIGLMQVLLIAAGTHVNTLE